MKPIRKSALIEFPRPKWWYISSGVMLLFAGGAFLYLAVCVPIDKPGGKPFAWSVGLLVTAGAMAAFGYSCRTVIDMGQRQVRYEWGTFFLARSQTYPLADVTAVCVRVALAGGTRIRTHHVYLALGPVTEGRRVQLQEIVYYEEAVQQARLVAEAINKPFIDTTTP